MFPKNCSTSTLNNRRLNFSKIHKLDKYLARQKINKSVILTKRAEEDGLNYFPHTDHEKSYLRHPQMKLNGRNRSFTSDQNKAMMFHPKSIGDIKINHQ
jgi:hypothetical protein